MVITRLRAEKWVGLSRPGLTSLLTSRAFLIPLGTFVATRLGILFIAYLATILLPASIDPPPYHLRPPDNILLDAFGSRWDTGFYVSIVEEGYIVENVPFPSVAFFPLLPLLMKALLPITGDAVIAGLVVSNVALLLATFVFYQLVSREWGEQIADRAIWYWLIFPTAFFGSAIYTESLFLLCVLSAFYFARTGRWHIAAIFAIATTLTRFVGIIIVPVLLVEWGQQRLQGSQSRWGWLASVVAPAGLLSYMLYLQQKFGNPLAFMEASSAWGRVPQSPAKTVATLFEAPAGGWLTALQAGHIHINDWFDFSMILLFALLGLVLIYQHRWSEGVFVWVSVMLTFSSGLLMSQRRYVWVLFPAFILLARWGHHPWVDRLITVLSLLGLALFTALFANGYWVA